MLLAYLPIVLQFVFFIASFDLIIIKLESTWNFILLYFCYYSRLLIQFQKSNKIIINNKMLAFHIYCKLKRDGHPYGRWVPNNTNTFLPCYLFTIIFYIFLDNSYFSFFTSKVRLGRCCIVRFLLSHCCDCVGPSLLCPPEALVPCGSPFRTSFVIALDVWSAQYFVSNYPGRVWFSKGIVSLIIWSNIVFLYHSFSVHIPSLEIWTINHRIYPDDVLLQ